MSADTLVCRRVTKAFAGSRRGDGAALREIDLDVPGGTSMVLLGSSGAGKTTLLRIIAGLDAADAGSIELGDRVLSDPDVRVPPERRRVGMVFQALELWPHMTVAEHLAFGLEGRPSGRSASAHPVVTALAEQVGIDAALLDRRPDTLSGGEQQRVAIARTLGPEPDVLLYDEPLANLDPDRRRTLRALIRRLARERQTTLVYVTHDPEEALEIGDEIAVLAQGRLVERGPPQALYRSPRTLAGAQALGPVTVLRAEVRGRRLETALGTLDPVDPDRLDEAAVGGFCLALLRPEDVAPETQGGALARVEDVVTRARDWVFRADLDGTPIYGHSDLPLEAGTSICLTATSGTAAVIAETSGGAR